MSREKKLSQPQWQFIHKEVDGNGDCGYSAFYGEKVNNPREEAYQSLSQAVDPNNDHPDKKEVIELLVPLITETFITRSLKKNQDLLWLLRNNAPTPNHYLDLLGLISRANNAKNSSNEADEAKANIDKHIKDNPYIVERFIEYDIKTKKNWAHPAILRALAHLENTELYIWQSANNNSKKLIPVAGKDLWIYKPEKPTRRKDILYNGRDHYDRLILENSPQAGDGVYTYDSSEVSQATLTNHSRKSESTMPNTSKRSSETVSQSRGYFEAFLVNYKKRSAQEQAKEILNKVKVLHDEGYSRVGLTYSANYNQTQTIANCYHKEEDITKISGDNQARVIVKIEELLQTSKYKSLLGVFRILPVTTCAESGGGEKGTVKQIWLEKDLENIEQHLEKGGAVLGWQNEDSIRRPHPKPGWQNLDSIQRPRPNPDEEPPGPFAIGGGVSGALMPNQNQYIQGRLLELEEKYKKYSQPLNSKMLQESIGTERYPMEMETNADINIEKKQKQKHISSNATNTTNKGSKNNQQPSLASLIPNTSSIVNAPVETSIKINVNLVSIARELWKNAVSNQDPLETKYRYKEAGNIKEPEAPDLLESKDGKEALAIYQKKIVNKSSVLSPTSSAAMANIAKIALQKAREENSESGAALRITGCTREQAFILIGACLYKNKVAMSAIKQIECDGKTFDGVQNFMNDDDSKRAAERTNDDNVKRCLEIIEQEINPSSIHADPSSRPEL